MVKDAATAEQEIPEVEAPAKMPESNVRIPPGLSRGAEANLRAGKKIRGRATRNTQKHGYDISGVRGQLQKGRVYDFPYDVFLVLYEAGYVEEYGGA